jgi:CheY-like chemotaxis protein
MELNRPPIESEQHLAGQRIALLVEDEWLIRMELADALSSAGWTVIEASSGEEAKALLAESEGFDLLVTDIRLEGALNGWDVAELFRAGSPRGPVIYASGNAPLGHRQVSSSAFLPKPVLVDELLASVDRICRLSPG